MLKSIPSPALRAAAGAAAAVAAIHTASALTADLRLRYTEVYYPSKRLPAALDGYTVAFLTDIHTTPEKKLQEIVAELNRRTVHAVLLGGDFAAQYLGRSLGVLARLRPADGVFAVEGNHDNPRRYAAALRVNGMTYLRNGHIRPRPGLVIAGLTDPEHTRPDVVKALAGVPADDFVLLACHNPDISMEQDFSRADLALCGHTHGGEAVLFGRWAPALYTVSAYGQRFRAGLCRSAAGTDILVSRGIGSHLPLRVCAPPEVLIVRLVAANTASQTGGRITIKGKHTE